MSHSVSTLPITRTTMSSNTVNDKTGKPIHIGDTVSTRMRGGKRTGEVWHPDSSGSLIRHLTSGPC